MPVHLGKTTNAWSHVVLRVASIGFGSRPTWEPAGGHTGGYAWIKDNAGGLEIGFATEYNPSRGWAHYDVMLDDQAGWRVGATGEPVTEAEMLTVLASLGQIIIRGEFRGAGGETVGIDGVRLDLGP